MSRFFCMGVSLLLASASAVLCADPLDHWHWRNPLPQGCALYGSAVRGDLFVAVGELGTVLVSYNGTDWTVTNAPVVTNLNAVCEVEGQLLAVGDGGTILLSTDGTDWIQQASPTTNSLRAITRAAGLTVIVGQYGVVLTSPSVSGWTLNRVQVGDYVSFNDVTFGDGRYVAVGGYFQGDAYGRISAASFDGTNWEASTGAPYMNSVVYGHGRFLATAGSWFAVSWDGLTWNHYYPASGGSATELAFADGQFIASSAAGGVVHSLDATNWIKTSASPGSYHSISVAGDQALAVGEGGAIAVSANLVDWTTISSGPGLYAQSITFGQDCFVAVGSRVFRSVDGHDWIQQFNGTGGNLPSVFLNSVAYGLGRFIAVGSAYYPTKNLISSDGLSFVSLQIPTSNTLNAIAFINGRFVAVGEAGTVCSSSDGTNWTTRFIPGGPHLRAVTHGNGHYVTVGYAGIHASPDLENWTPTGGMDVNWFAVAYGNGMFVAGGTTQSGKTAAPVMRSTDGLSWQPVSSYPGRVSSLAYGHGFFVAAGSQGLVTSTNGSDWVYRKDRLFAYGTVVAYGRRTFVASRFYGGIVQSDEFAPPPRLGVLAYQNGKFTCSLLEGEAGASYQLQSSLNLKDWNVERTVVPTQFPFAITNPASGPARFYRTAIP